jgi:hypothetical protein
LPTSAATTSNAGSRAFDVPIVLSTVGVGYGYDVMIVADAVGGRSEVAHRTAIERLSHAGAVPTTSLAVTTELFRNWAGPLYEPALDVIYWYFREAPKHTKDVGVAEAETEHAAARPAG